MYALLWFVAPFLSAERYSAIVARLAESRIATRQAQELRKMIGGLAQESRIFERILSNRLGGLGFQYAARAKGDRGRASGSGQAKPVTFKVRFEQIFLKPEYFLYKLRIRERTLFSTRNALPHLTRVGDLISEEVALELSAACERKVTTKYEDPRFGVWYLVHRVEGVGLIPRRVQFSDMIEHYPADMTLLPWVMGIGQSRRVETLYLSKHPHLLIAGPTGGGKSNAVNCFICGLMNMPPDELKILLIDLKEGVEFDIYKDSVHLYKDIVRKPEEAIEALTALSVEIDRRLKMLRESGTKDLPGYNAAHPENKLPFIVAIIDEYAQVVLPVSKKVRDTANGLVVRISALGRAAGIQIIICTQYPTREVIDPQIKINLNLKVAFRCQNDTQSRVILNSGGAELLPADVPGRALYALGADIRQVQVALITEHDIREAIERARAKAALITEPPITEEDTPQTALVPVPVEPVKPDKIRPFLIEQTSAVYGMEGTNAMVLYMAYRQYAGREAVGASEFTRYLEAMGLRRDPTTRRWDVKLTEDLS